MKHHGWHVFVWRLLFWPMTLLVRLKFNFTADRAHVKGPYLFLCNHNTDWDPLLCACSFREQMYYVTSEHLLRHGFGGKLVAWLQDPIPRQKGGSAADTVLAILRRLKKGYNVGFFPEGNRSWDGVTQSFLPSTGKLARTAAASGASLVTYRIEGGYFANPRWAGPRTRRGRMTGRVVRVYAPEELRAMTADEINGRIRADLYEDAYARQRETPVAFRGTRLAEHLETLLFLCPRCGGVGTLSSRDDAVTCSRCGLSFRYLPTGFLEGDAPWDNLRDWNLWQTAEIRRLCDEAGDEPIFSDPDMTCGAVDSGRGVVPVGRGTLRLWRDRLELPGVTLPLKEITGISLRGPQDIYFGTAVRHYEVRSDALRCTVRYLTAISHLNGGADYGV